MKTMKLNTIITALTASGLLCGACMCLAATEEGKEAVAKNAKLEAQARIGKAEAEKIALEKVPGSKVQEAELEQQDGKLVWSFDLTTPGTKEITEAVVDAKTGTVVSVEKESPESEMKEKKGKERDEEDAD